MSEDNKTLNEIVSVLISERKRDYRNKIIFRIFIFIAFISLLFIAPMAKDINFSQPHIAVIEVNGLIASESQSSAENIIPLLKRASENVNTSVIIIKVNSINWIPLSLNKILVGDSPIKIPSLLF